MTDPNKPQNVPPGDLADAIGKNPADSEFNAPPGDFVDDDESEMDDDDEEGDGEGDE